MQKAFFTEAQAFFTVARQQVSTWKEVIKSGESNFGNLENFCEQLAAIKLASSESSGLLLQFPDAKDKVIVKILEACEEQTTQLLEKLQKLGEIATLVTRSADEVEEVFQASELPLDVILQATATLPSVADVLEFVSEYKTVLCNEHKDKTDRLQQLDYWNVDVLVRLKGQWLKTRAVDELEKKVAPYLVFFMKENFKTG